jgi:hypothetical protein
MNTLSKLSRSAQISHMDPSQEELEEEDVISGPEEGDEIMEEGDEPEGYSMFLRLRLSIPHFFLVSSSLGLQFFTFFLI